MDWHLAGIAEARGDYRAALDAFKQLVDDSRYLPLEEREWYVGMGWVGVSRAQTRVSDTLEARKALLRAYSHQFCNGPLLEEDTFFANVVGRPFIDSLDRFWKDIDNQNKSEWAAQEPIVFRPHDARPGQPLIIAMHGGIDSYRAFSTYWSGIADSAHATIIVPPGIIRNSEVQNSWEYDISTIAPSILKLRRESIAQYAPDTSRIYLAGFSQGAQAAIAITLQNPTLFRGTIAFAGFLFEHPSDSILDRAARQHVRVYALSGEWETPKFLDRLKEIHKRAELHYLPFHLEIENQMAHEMPLDFQSRFAEAWRWIREPVQATNDRGVPHSHATSASGQ